MLISFDWDGTILQTEYLLAQKVSEMAQENGMNIDADSVFTRFSGMGSKEKFRLIAEHTGVKVTDDDLNRLQAAHRAAKKNLYEDLSCVKVFNDVAWALNELQEQGHTLCVNSNNKQDLCVLSAKHHGLDKFFPENAIFTSDRVGDIKKPDPAMFYETFKVMQESPGNTIHIDDTLAGLQGAFNAYVRRIAFLNPRFGAQSEAHKEQLDKADPVAMFSDYRDLPAIISRLSPSPQ